MHLKSLRIFREVARSGSFVVAADILNTVQSNVTAHIKKLELELDVKLIDRSGQVRLTSAGHALMRYVENILATHDEAISFFKHQHPSRGRLRIGAMETTTALRLPPILTAFHKTYPEIELTLTTGATAELTSGLIDGQYDCVFVAGEVNHSQLHMFKAFDERLVLVSGAKMADMPSAEELQTATFLAFRQGCSYRQRVELLLAHYGVYATRIFEFGTLDAMLGCVVAGMGYAVLPEKVIDSHRDRFQLYTYSLPADIGEVATYFIAQQKEAWSPTIALFSDTVQTFLENT